MKRKRNGAKPVFCESKDVPKIKQVKLDLLNKKDLNKFLKSKEFKESKIAEELIIEYISSVKQNSPAKKMLLINKESFNKYIKNNSINTKADVETLFAICEETKEEDIKQISINLENKKELIKLLKENSKKHQKQIDETIIEEYITATKNDSIAKKDILKGETTKESLEKEAENTEENFEHQTEKIKTVKIGNNVYKLNEHEYKKFMEDIKNIIEEEVETKLRRLDEEEYLKFLITYDNMESNGEMLW